MLQHDEDVGTILKRLEAVENADNTIVTDERHRHLSVSRTAAPRVPLGE